MESRIVNTVSESYKSHKLWLYKASGNIWMKTQHSYVLVYTEKELIGFKLGDSVTLETFKDLEFEPFHGTIELKE